MSTTDTAADHLSTRPAASVATAVRPHPHGWQTESRHRTSEGIISYVRCVTCGARRVDLADPLVAVPAPLSQAMTTEQP